MRLVLLALAALLLAGCEHLYGAGDVRVTESDHRTGSEGTT